MKEKRTKSDTGEELLVQITDDEIRALRIRKPKLRVIGKKKGRSEKELEEAIARKPVMEITKVGKNRFDVDLGAGLQRACSISDQDIEDLTEEVDVSMYGGEDIHSDKGWLEWIGLDPKDKDLDDFLGRKKKKLVDVI